MVLNDMYCYVALYLFLFQICPRCFSNHRVSSTAIIASIAAAASIAVLALISGGFSHCSMGYMEPPSRRDVLIQVYRPIYMYIIAALIHESQQHVHRRSGAYNPSTAGQRAYD